MHNTVFSNWFNGCFISFDGRFNSFNGRSIAIEAFFIAIYGSAVAQVWSIFSTQIPNFTQETSFLKFLNFSFRILTLSLGGLQRLERSRRNCSRGTTSMGEIRNKEKFTNFQALRLEV